MHPTCDEARTCAQGSGRPGPCRDIGKSTMKFMLTFSLKPETKARDEAIGRFKATGARSPKGAKLLGRWTTADFSGGFDPPGRDDGKALTGFSLHGSDLTQRKTLTA